MLGTMRDLQPEELIEADEFSSNMFPREDEDYLEEDEASQLVAVAFDVENWRAEVEYAKANVLAALLEDQQVGDQVGVFASELREQYLEGLYEGLTALDSVVSYLAGEGHVRPPNLRTQNTFLDVYRQNAVRRIARVNEMLLHHIEKQNPAHAS